MLEFFIVLVDRLIYRNILLAFAVFSFTCFLQVRWFDIHTLRSISLFGVSNYLSSKLYGYSI